MDAAQFQLPVRLVMRAGESVTEIYSAEEALDLLLRWPVQEGPIFQRALSTCLAAAADPAERDEAHEAFVVFARVTGLLARDVPLDSL